MHTAYVRFAKGYEGEFDIVTKELVCGIHLKVDQPGAVRAEALIVDLKNVISFLSSP